MKASKDSISTLEKAVKSLELSLKKITEIEVRKMSDLVESNTREMQTLYKKIDAKIDSKNVEINQYIQNLH